MTMQYSGAWLLSVAVSIMVVAPAHGLPRLPASIAIPTLRALRGGSAQLTAAQRAVLESKAYIHWVEDQFQRGGQLDQLKERLEARLNGQTLVQTHFWFPAWPGVRQVAVIGSWGDWMVLHDLRCEEDEGKWRWEVSVNLPVGEHLFKFIVDGQWVLGAGYDVVPDGVATEGNHRTVVVRAEAEEGERADDRLVHEAISTLADSAEREALQALVRQVQAAERSRPKSEPLDGDGARRAPCDDGLGGLAALRTMERKAALAAGGVGQWWARLRGWAGMLGADEGAPEPVRSDSVGVEDSSWLSECSESAEDSEHTLPVRRAFGGGRLSAMVGKSFQSLKDFARVVSTPPQGGYLQLFLPVVAMLRSPPVASTLDSVLDWTVATLVSLQTTGSVVLFLLFVQSHWLFAEHLPTDFSKVPLERALRAHARDIRRHPKFQRYR